ncbi:MAG: DUF5110 domain-containing protein [Treponema sp.]|nr:DUF5110 domain-containing protein [Treponema sp.]
MKKLLSILSLFFLAFYLWAAEIKTEDGISVSFDGCMDGSIHFVAKTKKSLHPAKDFELKRELSQKKFIKNSDGSYLWEEYRIQPEKKGYTLFFKEKPLYTSSFSMEKTLLREIREWKTAKEFYGFGEAPTAVNLSNQSWTIYNESKYGNHALLFIPYYFSDESTSVYYNANSKDKIYFQEGSDPQVYRSEYRRIDCYVRQDTSAQSCVQKFYEETGTSCMLPKWAYGYIQSKYGYESADEVIQLADDFKKHQIPLSAVVLDLYWFEKMGDIFWTNKNYQNYQEMEERLEKDGIKLITITEPFFTSDSKNFEELKKSGLLCKNNKGKLALWRDWWCFDSKDGGLFNPFEKKAADFMGKRYKEMLDSGIDGFWTDLGEPEGAWNVKGLKYGKFEEMDLHNYYNYYWSKALFEGLHKLEPDRRLFIMSRSGFTGIGKFNVSVWSGDVAVSWPSLGKNIAWGINAGLTGLPYWGSDIGGFTPEESPEELYIRWQQFGAFTPVYRAHGTGPREPFAFSEKAEKIVANLIKNRERLLPYIYSTARQTMSGSPMMRPMFFEDKNTPSKFNEKQFMFGDWILVSPITQEAVYESEHQTYLPQGDWYDFFTLEKADSKSEGRIVTTKNTIEKIPVYIKEGAIIPFAEKNTAPAATDEAGKSAESLAGTKSEKADKKNYGFFVIPFEGSEKKSSSFTLYNDDGVSEQYKNGNFSELKIQLTCENGKNLLKAQASEKRDYLSEVYTISLPKKAAAGKDWTISQSNPNTKEKTFTLEELLKGISF